jgi:hypothetical protein
MIRILRAIRLAVLITRRPWWDKDEPFCNINPRLAWKIASDIWLNREISDE